MQAIRKVAVGAIKETSCDNEALSYTEQLRKHMTVQQCQADCEERNGQEEWCTTLEVNKKFINFAYSTEVLLLRPVSAIYHDTHTNSPERLTVC